MANTQNSNIDQVAASKDAFQNRYKALQFNPPNTKFDNLSNTPQSLETGVASIFNPYALVAFPYTEDGQWKNRLYDGINSTPTNNDNFTSKKSKHFTIRDLVEDEQMSKSMPYRYSDFLYCKWIRRIPLNRLLTLRRYGAPTYDNLTIPGVKGENGPEYFKPVAQAVTFFGEGTDNKLSELLSFTLSMNWKKVEAEVNKVMGNEQGAEGIDNRLLSGLGKLIGALNGDVNSAAETAGQFVDPYEGGPYAHKVYGPVNVINSVYKRDRGIDFKQTFNLTFEYHLESIGNVNPKAAMLDLMSNLLSLTYNNAAFWGGANRYFPAKPTYPFLGGKDGQNAWYRGDAKGFSDAVSKSFSNATSGIGSFLDTLGKDFVGSMKKLAAGAMGIGMIEMSKGRAPDVLQFKALLTGEPIGEWHLVVGNPYEPIEMIGNLICTETKFSFNDVLGQDDFPTELKMVVTLEHGRPRDKGDIESMFNKGAGRIYYAYKNGMEPWNSASSTMNSVNDQEDKNVQFGKNPIYTGPGSNTPADNFVMAPAVGQTSATSGVGTGPLKTKENSQSTARSKPKPRGKGVFTEKASDVDSTISTVKNTVSNSAKTLMSAAEKAAHDLAAKFSPFTFGGGNKK